jgi:transcriptional regulator of acetoin/glycerol metabolism
MPVGIDLEDPAAWDRLAEGETLILRHADRLAPVMQGRLLEQLAPGARVIAIMDSTAPLTAPTRARIATIEIAVPPLAERGDDALILARHFARIAALRHGRPAPLHRRRPGAAHWTTWPDEVRGLALAVERAVLLADDDTIEAAAIMPALRRRPGRASPISIWRTAKGR